MGRFVERKGTPDKMEIAFVEGMLNGMQVWMIACQNRAKELAPVKTSRLVNEIEADPMGPKEVDRLVVKGLVGVKGLVYARAHELGSGIHSLDPTERELIKITAGFWTGKSQAKALAFEWPEGPKPHPAYNEEKNLYFFHTVYHPGVRPANEGRGYLRLAARETMAYGRRALIEGIAARLSRERTMA